MLPVCNIIIFSKANWTQQDFQAKQFPKKLQNYAVRNEYFTPAH
jgi:hypothetical protein